ncbi:tail sheath stabilizer [Synechococcus phage S-N03]|uniref:Tail sheath stabilizer n=1 Tax=Synechococcus phage S-N03 TaxID=2718943 RepID=A0A6G8R631_9CAUD|nr:tail sheath stabilizer [Synechococcus phage S-N03]QIN96867.1 tail sheath stabilizer [Synechococcus phage S-N03]
MLGRYYYHSIFRKSIMSFGTLFNNIAIKRQSADKTATLDSIKVPIKYGPTQKFLARIAAEPGSNRQQVQMNLPVMSFEIKGVQYDQSRKLPPTQFAKTTPQEGSEVDGQPVQMQQYLPVPYTLNMELSILSKNQDDGLQILEQILPNFHPLVSVSIVVIDETHEERDIAVVLNSIDYTDEYEADFTTRRFLQWKLNFQVKTYLFGPVDVQKDIRKAIVNYRTDIANRNTELRYTAEVASTDEPPIPRDEINPETDGWEVEETYEDIHSDDQFFGVS